MDGGKPVNGNTCMDYATRYEADSYLIGFTYGSGYAWVSAPGDHCSDAANGAFTAYANL